MPLISAIVVHYDGPEHLDRCLGSLSAAAEGRLEVILVDNAPRGRSAREAADRYPAVRRLSPGQNLGFGAANNLAAAEARGEALLFLNNDAWLGDGCLAALAGRLERDPSLGLVAPQLYYPDGRPQTVWNPDVSLFGEALRRLRNRVEGRPFSHRGLVRLLRPLAGPGWYSAACVLVRKRAFEAVGGFDPGFFLYFEDADLCLRLRRAGWRLAQAPGAAAFHASAGGGRGGWVAAEYRKSQLRFYRLHRPRWEQAALARYLRWRSLEPATAPLAAPDEGTAAPGPERRPDTAGGPVRRLRCAVARRAKLRRAAAAVERAGAAGRLSPETAARLRRHLARLGREAAGRPSPPPGPAGTQP